MRSDAPLALWCTSHICACVAALCPRGPTKAAHCRPLAATRTSLLQPGAYLGAHPAAALNVVS
eukprot:6462503-Prymnesium_polylepis.1